MTETADSTRIAESAEAQANGPATAMEQLVAARKAAGLGASDIAAKLGMMTRQIEALERGDWQALPGQAFVRGALRSYGKTVGVDVEPLLATLGGQVRAPELRASASLEAPMPRGGALGFGGGGSGSRLAWIVLGVAAVIAMALYFGDAFEIGENETPAGTAADGEAARISAPAGLRSSTGGTSAGSAGPAVGGPTGTSAGASTGTSARPASPAAGASASPGSSGTATTDPASGASQAASSSSGIAPLQPLTPLAPLAPAGTPPAGAPAGPSTANGPASSTAPGGSTGSPASGAPGASTGAEAPGATSSADSGSSAAPGPGAGAPGAKNGAAAPAREASTGSAAGTTAGAGSSAAAAATDTLKLRFDRESWVEIRGGDGKVLLTGLQPAGSSRELGGRKPFKLVIGNAQHVTLEFEGKPVDLAARARQGVARLTLD